MTGSGCATLYGIPNCDTVKKARVWLAAHGVGHAFHNYRTDGIDRGRLERWVQEAGWEKVLNRAGTTFRALADEDKHGLDAKKAVTLMLAQPSLIKRPVLERGDLLLLGFKPEIYASALGG
ncbi:MAG: ArsC family reductase [Hyphomonadaceae bacterium]|nr:MAG: hypothetical protein FD160_2962 [Caulobacteraceae bacterium]MBT9446909.1 ArsC family reductase [Hyphomonadaceae bacterium]TPW08684.1 MAG: hypothetical protein FD124_223 [Alphaproteobacteria bacterium]